MSCYVARTDILSPVQTRRMGRGIAERLRADADHASHASAFTRIHWDWATAEAELSLESSGNGMQLLNVSARCISHPAPALQPRMQRKVCRYLPAEGSSLGAARLSALERAARQAEDLSTEVLERPSLA